MSLKSRIASLFRRSPPEPAAPLALPAPAMPADPVLASAVAALHAMVDAPDRATFEAGAATIAALSKAAASSPTESIGRPGFDVFGGYLSDKEKAADMRGSAKWTTFGENVRNVPVVGAGARRGLLLAGSPTWSVQPLADDDGPDAADHAEFAEDQLRHLATPWRVVTQTGFRSVYEGFTIQVWTARAIDGGKHAGKIGLADVAERPAHTIDRWEYTPDRATLLGVWQRDASGGNEFFIPRERMVFSQDIPLTDSPIRVGIFRHLAEPVREWHALRKISRQGFETDLAGIPVIYAPLQALKEKIGKPAYPNGPVFTIANYEAAAQGLLTFTESHVRTKQTGLLFDSGTHPTTAKDPSSVPLYRFELAAAGGTAHEPVLAAMGNIEWGMAILLGCADLLIGQDGGGSLAMAKIKTADGYRLIVSGLNAWAEVVQRDLFRPLWILNGWDPMTAPLPSWDRLEFEDVPALIASLFAALSQFGITGTRADEIVNYIIKRFGLPPLEDDEGDLAIPPVNQQAADKAGIGKPRTGDNPEGVITPDDAKTGADGAPVVKRKLRFDDLED